MKANRIRLVERAALAVPEQRRDLGLSLSELARLAGVSRSTVTRVERGGRVDPALVLRVAAALTVLELYAPSKGDLLGDLHPGRLLVAPARPLLQPTPTLGGAA
jgi:transcriptional regulator with XRE-family HTH domain